MNKGKLIVIEGIDKAGKQTQAEMLQDYLTMAKGKDTVLRSFPFYDSHSGICIKRYLKGEEHFSQKTINMIYSVNRYEQRYWLNLFLNNNTIVILDRYYYSNMAYGCPLGVNRIARMLEIEDMDCEMPEPDYVLFIDISPEMSQQRNSNQDINERNLEFLRCVRQNYLDLVKRYNWIVIDGEMDKEKVHKSIISKLEYSGILN